MGSTTQQQRDEWQAVKALVGRCLSRVSVVSTNPYDGAVGQLTATIGGYVLGAMPVWIQLIVPVLIDHITIYL